MKIKNNFKVSHLSSLILLSAFIPLSFSCQNSSDTSVNSNSQIINALDAKTDCSSVVTYKTGNPEDVQKNPQSGFVLMGGGKDVDQAFRWMIKKSGGGDFVVLRTSGADGYNNYIYSDLAGVNSVETIMIDSREKAECPSVAEKIRNAEALFISGGDQSQYYSYWKGTATQNAIDYLVNVKKAPIGGTSAGLAILGQVIYTAENGSITSPTALKNPYDSYITLKKDFLDIPVLKNVITDTHFSQRDRQGRLISFMARAIKDGVSENYNTLKGIAVDESTAYVLEEDGTGKVLGNNNVWFFRGNSNPENCSANTPLTWNGNKQAVKTYVLKGSENGDNSFNIKSWTPSGNSKLINYYVDNGILKQDSTKK